MAEHFRRAFRMSAVDAKSGTGSRLAAAVNDPRLMVAVMFACMWLVAVLAVQRKFSLGMPSPQSRLLTLGGFLTGSGRVLGISRLTPDSMG